MKLRFTKESMIDLGINLAIGIVVEAAGQALYTYAVKPALEKTVIPIIGSAIDVYKDMDRRKKEKKEEGGQK